MGLPLHVINTSSSLYTFTYYLVKMETLPLLAVLPTRMSDVLNYSNVSSSAAFLDNCGKGRIVTYSPFHLPPFATPTCFFNACRIGNSNPILSASLI